MLKFIKHNMDTIAGIGIFPLISFIIFFLFFIVLFIWVINMKKTEIELLSNLPLNADDQVNSELTNNTPNS